MKYIDEKKKQFNRYRWKSNGKEVVLDRALSET